MRRLVLGFGVLGLYLGLLVCLAWPLAAEIGTALPEPYKNDRLLIAWALSHQSRALVGDPLNVVHANIYHPAPASLLYGEAGFGAVPYFMPTFLRTGNPTLARNVMVLGCLALTALALHLVVVRWTGHTSPAS